MIKKSRKVIYLDHAATTYVDPTVIKAMQPFWGELFANPSSLYKSGVDTKNAIDNARESISKFLECRPSEIIFTSGGTESINLAIFGATRQYELKYKKKGHIITSTIEHHAVLNSVAALKEESWKVDYAPVSPEGFVKIDELKKLVQKDTILISIMYANNEIGSVQPIAEIGKWLAGLNKVRVQQNLPQILFHTDACQAGGSFDLNTQALHVDLLSLNSSKIYGPKGAGLLFVKTGIQLRPLLFGGGQEKNLRSGTENVPGIIGFCTALVLAQKNRQKENQRLNQLRNYFDGRLSKKVKEFSYNGPKINIIISRNKINPTESITRLPNNININFKGVEGVVLMMYLDAHNIQVSTRSACATMSEDPSHVLHALGLSTQQAKESIRITLGKKTTKQDLEYTVDVISVLVEQIRKTISS